jgi:D-alanyl-D-alanine dipeptidase
MNSQFVFVDEVLSELRWDAKYATWDNFTGRPVDGYCVNRILASTAVCAGLERAARQAASLGFGLLLWDAYRPQRAVDRFLRWLEEPENRRTKAQHHPNISKAEMLEQGYVAAKSAHSRGAAVDLTLYDLASAELLQMGGGFDLMDARSHHGAKEIAEVEAANRRRLLAVMEASGFRAYEREWWHYELEHEPYPETYFDFPIAATAIRSGDTSEALLSFRGRWSRRRDSAAAARGSGSGHRRRRT